MFNFYLLLREHQKLGNTYAIKHRYIQDYEFDFSVGCFPVSPDKVKQNLSGILLAWQSWISCQYLRLQGGIYNPQIICDGNDQQACFENMRLEKSH